MRYFLFVCWAWLSSHVLFAQLSLSGVVTDTRGNPLVSASVIIHELDRGVTTDIDGKFLFSDLKAANYHLHVSYIGYEAVTMLLNVRDRLDTAIVMQPTSLELSEIVVESNHYKTGPKEHTLAMEIIDLEYLQEHNKGTLINSLEDLPGVNAINTGVGVSKLVIRGLSFNRVIVNDKGVKQEGQQWGADHGLEIDMFEPGRVEVVKGPSSLMYGSDGLGGVLNIFPPSLPESGKHKGGVHAVYKSNNQLIGTSTFAEGGLGDNIYRLRLSSQDFGDYRVPAENFVYNGFVLPLYDNQLKNSAGKERNVTGMVGVKKDWGYSTLTVSNFHQKAGFFVGAYGIPRAIQLSSDGDDRNIDLPRQIINHFKIISNSNILLGKNWLELDVGYQNNYRQEQSKPHVHGKGPRPEGNLALALRLQTYSLNARYFMHLSDNHSRIIGLQGQQQYNARDGFEFLIADFQSSSLGGFVYEEFTLRNKLTANIGIRFDHANRLISEYLEPVYSDETTITGYFQRNGQIDASYNNFSGAIGLSYYPKRELNFKANLGSSFKMPTPTELSTNGVHHGAGLGRHEIGDSLLTYERGFQGDISISYQRSNLSLVLTPFVSLFKDFIYAAPASSFSSTNGTQIYHFRQNDVFFTGGELSMEYHPVEPLHLRSALEYVYNYNLETKLALPFTPPASIFSEVHYDLPTGKTWVYDMTVGLSHKWVFDQNRVDRNERATAGYHLLTFSAGASINLGFAKIDIDCSIQNLTDNRFFDHLSRYRQINLPEQGRNYVVSLRIPFARD